MPVQIVVLGLQAHNMRLRFRQTVFVSRDQMLKSGYSRLRRREEHIDRRVRLPVHVKVPGLDTGDLPFYDPAEPRRDLLVPRPLHCREYPLVFLWENPATNKYLIRHRHTSSPTMLQVCCR